MKSPIKKTVTIAKDTYDDLIYSAAHGVQDMINDDIEFLLRCKSIVEMLGVDFETDNSHYAYVDREDYYLLMNISYDEEKKDAGTETT